MIWKVKSLKPFPWESCNLLFQLRGTKYSRRWVERRQWRRLLACRGLYSLLARVAIKKKRGGGLSSVVAQLVKNPPAMWETWVRSLGWEDPLEEGMATHSSILVWRMPTDRGALWVAVHGVARSQTWLSSRTELDTGSFLCMSPSLESLYVSKFPPYKDTSQIGWRLTLMTLS